MIPLAAFALAGCLAVNAGSDGILAGDLAKANPLFSAVPADAEVALAPAPGVARVFGPAELARLALHWHLPAAPQTEMCFIRPVAAPDPAQLLPAMRKELPDARIEILDYSRHPQPEGEIVFPLRGLQAGASGAMWMGYVRYGSNRRFTVWARVKVLETVDRVVAAGDLRAGEPIAAASVAAQTRDGFPSPGPYAKSADEVVGKWARVAIRAGSAIRLDQIEPAKEVLRGDTVKVEVRAGSVRMEAEAQAEGSGALHDVIPVQNTTSKKRFLARVEGKDQVSVDASTARVLP
jgi:flagella basal body P-ring formation protein FlgA